jgi:hypothetical protein
VSVPIRRDGKRSGIDMMRQMAVLLLGAALSGAGALAQARLPDGWRAPTAPELSFPGDKWRDRNPDKFQIARADFDGDGRQDEARLLVSSDGRNSRSGFSSLRVHRRASMFKTSS